MSTRFLKGLASTGCAICLLLLSACVSYEPLILVPALNLSPEQVSLTRVAARDKQRIDFGLQPGLNESDSLSNIEILPGVRVRGVSTNGPADLAGIQPGDIILSIDGTLTNHPDVIEALQQQAATEENYIFTVRRNTVVFEAMLTPRTIINNPAPQELYRVDPIASRAGYRTEMVNISGQTAVAAARVVEIFPESPLAAAGISAGDLILTINGTPLNSAQDLVSRFNSEFALGDTVQVTVSNGQALSEVRFDLWNPGRRISEVSLGPLLRYQSSLTPKTNSLSILDFWLFAFYSYSRVDEERSHSILGLINFSSDLGELIEEEN